MLEVGFDVIEFYFVYGYFVFFFLSFVVNKRIDKYGGSFENCICLVVEFVREMCKVLLENIFLFVCISVIDWFEENKEIGESWICEDSVCLVEIFVKEGVDVLDVLSGGNYVV